MEQKGNFKINIMMPLDTLHVDGELRGKPKNLKKVEQQLKLAMENKKVEGAMIDIWWGLVERAPQEYDFGGYIEVFKMFRRLNLKVQPVFSFHQCGGNIGDQVTINLPDFVLKCASENRLFYEDQFEEKKKDPKYQNVEYLSPSANLQRVFPSKTGAFRTGLELYKDFLSAFVLQFGDFMGIIDQIHIGCGPCAEMRYPSYPSYNGWQYPSYGQFMCFDPIMFKKLQTHFTQQNQQIDKEFFQNMKSYSTYELPADTEKLQLFMEFYEEQLIDHTKSLIEIYKQIFASKQLSVKISGVHWQYGNQHAAEWTTGYYNTKDRNGYARIAELLGKTGVSLCFTCVEKLNNLEHKWCDSSMPEDLVQQIVDTCDTYNVHLHVENAQELYEEKFQIKKLVTCWRQYNQMVKTFKAADNIESLTFLRLDDRLFKFWNWVLFKLFVRKVRGQKLLQHPLLMAQAVLGLAFIVYLLISTK